MPIQDEKDEKRLNADIPNDLHREISILAAKKGVRLKALVIEAVELLLTKYRNYQLQQAWFHTRDDNPTKE
ncbi:hypothetical protein ACQKGD_26050 [Peribacillus frigoritolerans]|uniref:hypothetical protein n=1 Tax=Peribacillus frigoritolerans TaxID=450367 RepID=UPI0020797185|nr:hypothetical protein [Peribacillus frigoritolerans]USK64477.1 hypothetical protein LIT26_25555 [Peribacillus frigoritolerans]